MTGVEAEADVLGAGRRGERVEDALDPVEVAGHGVVAAGGVLDQQRDLEIGGLDRLAPVVEAATRRVVGGVDVTAMDDQAAGPDLGRGVHVLLEQLARGDPDAVVGRRDVDDVGRVDVQPDACRLRVGTQRLRTAGVPDLGALVALRVA